MSGDRPWVDNAAAEHEIHGSVASMIAPPSLSRVLDSPVIRVRRRPFNGRDGMSRNKFESVIVDTADGSHQRFVLKHLSIETDWIMAATRDQRCRSVTLWRYGLLDRVSPGLGHPVIACSHDRRGYAILMVDLSANLLFGTAPSATWYRQALDSLAVLHASFWDASELASMPLGLCDTRALIEMFSPRLLSRGARVPSRLPIMIAEGWEALATIVEPDVFGALDLLSADPQPLCDLIQRFPATLVHGDYRPGNLALMSGKLPAMVAFDWQCAGCSLGAIDLTWFCTDVDVLRSGTGLSDLANYYARRIGESLGARFDRARWPQMLDIGFLVDALRKVCFHAWFAVTLEDKTQRALYRESLERYSNVVRRALNWL